MQPLVVVTISLVSSKSYGWLSNQFLNSAHCCTVISLKLCQHPSFLSFLFILFATNINISLPSTRPARSDFQIFLASRLKKMARPSVLKCSPRCPQSMKTGESRPCRSPGTGLPARSRCVRIDPQTATLQGPQGISAQVLACRLLVLVRGVSWRCQIVFSRPC